MEVLVETTTLWDLLKEPWIALHMPRFGVFLFVALLIEIFCDIKRVNILCSFSTVLLLLLTGIAQSITWYYMCTTSFMYGERLLIPLWYYPVTAIMLIVLSVIFITGVAGMFKEKFKINGILRCIVFGISSYFAITLILTPTNINKVFEQLENEEQNQQVEPIATTPVDEVEAQSTQAHP